MAFKIDQRNVFEELGLDKLVELSTAFYTRVYADPDPGFRGMFPDDMAGAIQNQYEFLCQRFGGPQLYSERKGHPALRQRHAKFEITKARAAHWLDLMQLSLDEVGIKDNFAREALDEFFAHTAEFLVNKEG
jgi:truncated hemoglobin YjbI